MFKGQDCHLTPHSNMQRVYGRYCSWTGLCAVPVPEDSSRGRSRDPSNWRTLGFASFTQERRQGNCISFIRVEKRHCEGAFLPCEPREQHSGGEKSVWALSVPSQMINTRLFFVLAFETQEAEKVTSPLTAPRDGARKTIKSFVSQRLFLLQ